MTYDENWIEAANGFLGRTSSEVIYEIAVCVVLLRQGALNGKGVMRQKAVLAKEISGIDDIKKVPRRVREYVALSAYILLDQTFSKTFENHDEWKPEEVAAYLENRFSNMNEMKKFYGRSYQS